MVRQSNIRRFLKKHRVKKIVDSHTHTYEATLSRGKPVNFHRMPTKTITMTYPRFPISKLKLIESKLYKGFGVKAKRVAFGLPGYFVDVRQQNNYILKQSRADKTILPVALVTPQMSVAEIRSLVKRGFNGFKPYPEFAFKGKPVRSVFDYVTPNIIEVANKTGTPIIVHLSHDVGFARALKEIPELSKRCKRTRIVIAHMGEMFLTETSPKKFFEKLAPLKNVSVSTSMCVDPGTFRIAIRLLGSSRLMYGTDSPFLLLNATVTSMTKAQAKKIKQPKGKTLVEVDRKSYAWTDEKSRLLLSAEERRNIPRVLNRQVDAMYKAVNYLYRRGEISSADIRRMLAGNAERMFGEKK